MESKQLNKQERKTNKEHFNLLEFVDALSVPNVLIN